MQFMSTANDSIAVAQIILAGNAAAAGSSLLYAVDDVVRQERWRTRRSTAGIPFSSFGEFARAPQPSGLGVADFPTFRLLRFALIENRHYGPLAELIELSAREPGRSRPNSRC